MKSMPQPVFLQDMACISSAGDDLESAYKNMLQESSYRKAGCRANISRFSYAADAAEVDIYSCSKDVHAAMWKLVSEPSVNGSDPTARLLMLASQQISLAMSDGERDRCGVMVGSSRGASDLLEDSIGAFYSTLNPLSHITLSARTSPYTTASFLSSLLAQTYDLRGGHCYVSSACSSSLHALGMGFLGVRAGMNWGCLVGGVEWPSTPFCVAMLKRARVLAACENSHYPVLHSFGSERNGTVLGEGAAVALLVRQPRDAVMEICGFGMASESCGLVGLSEDGVALQQAFRRGLQQADIAIEDIDLVVVHGSGTIRGDEAEMSALLALYADIPCKPHVLITKWATGHTLGASGLLALGFAVEVCRNHRLPYPPYEIDARMAGWIYKSSKGGKRNSHKNKGGKNRGSGFSGKAADSSADAKVTAERVIGFRTEEARIEECKVSYGCVLGLGFGGSASALFFKNML